MKCINCNNDIPDGVSVCPVCNTVLNQSSGQEQQKAVPVDTSVLPVVPENPVLPVDQAATNENNVEVNATNVSADATSNINQVESAPAIQAEQAPSVVENVSAPVADVASTVEPQVSEPQQAPVNNQVTNDINPEFIQPNGEAVKIGNTLSPEAKKNKNKTNLIIIIAIVAVLAVAGIVFLVYYNSQYKSANKRIDAIVSAVTMKTKSLKNETIEKTSGSYDISLGISSSDTSMSFKADGNYSVDLNAKAVDYTLNLTSLNIGEELIDDPINLEFYLNDSRIYVLLQNYFDDYIYDEVEGLDSIFDVIEQNNIDYVSVINDVKLAFSNGLKAMSSTQTVDTVNIHGTSKKTNVIKINCNENNAKAFVKSFYTSLANSKKFVSEMSKFFDKSEEEYKNELLDNIDEVDYSDWNDFDIEIYTALFGNELDGIKVSGDSDEGLEVFEIYPTANGYGLSFKQGSQNILDLTYESTSKTTSTTVESTMKFTAVFYNEGEAFNIDLDYKNVRDVNPKDAKINVKNSINRKYLTSEQKESIISKAQNSGNVGLYLPSILSVYLNGGVSSSYGYGGMYDDDYSYGDDYGYGYDISGEYHVGGDDMTIVDCTEDPSLCE